MQTVLGDIEKSRLSKMLSNNKWAESQGDTVWAARILWDFGYIHSPEEMAYFMRHPLKRKYQLQQILEMD